MITVLLGALIGLLHGRLVPRLPFVLLVGSAILALALLAKRPTWCIAAILAGTMFGTNRSSLPVGSFDLRLTDLPLAILVGRAFLMRVRHGAVPRPNVGQLQLGLLLAVFALSLTASIASSADQLSAPYTSWLRLSFTFSLAWVIPYVIRGGRNDQLFVLRALVLLGAGELLAAIFLQPRAGGRLAGANGPDAEGLIALVVLIAVLNLALFGPRLRLLFGSIAVLALGLSASIGSVVALMVVLGIYGFRVTTHRTAWAAALVRPARIVLVVAGALLFLLTQRPQDIPTTDGFYNSSSASRLSVGYAGLQLFVDHPVLGVGWQRSSLGSVIGSDDVVDKVRKQFPGLRPALLPDGTDTSVHNAYIQILAEAGLAGFAILLLALAAGRRGIRHVIASAGMNADLARTFLVLLVAILIWWNDNPLFGAQPESVLFAIILGLVASVRPAAVPAESDPEVSATTRRAHVA